MKKFLCCFMIIVICCIGVAACNRNSSIEITYSTELPDSVEEFGDSVKSDNDSAVVRFPLLGENETNDYSEYYASGLQYPGTVALTDEAKKDSKQTIQINGKLYSPDYLKTMGYSTEASDYLKSKEYDIYWAEDDVEIQVFKKTGVIKKIYFYEKGLLEAPQLLNDDYSESNLRAVAGKLLVDLYDSSIQNYLDSYYCFEYARFFSYQNEEQNRYVVSYRAYINETPTDDVLYVQFTPEGKLLCVSAKNYIQYINVDKENLLPVEHLELQINNYLEKLDYYQISPRQKEPSCYYSMNIYGDLYYLSEWEAFKLYSDDTGVTNVEVLAVNARGK